ncbi:zinc finger protein 648 [Clonorchis sinensis]|uniref:Zinc finger protein 648 n=1 Tax=Clonorchis sinensis TaxID=79923 RepID=G7YMU1_CLOSI|nr:zinc finger protein 648 [Clonorchis sinensis]
MYNSQHRWQITKRLVDNGTTDQVITAQSNNTESMKVAQDDHDVDELPHVSPSHTEKTYNSLYPKQIDSIHKCPMCDKSFAHLSKALEHQKSHSTDREFHCSLCMRSFKHKNTLRRHVRKTHANQVDYLCLKAPSEQVRESEERGNPCPECDGNFATWDILQRHRKSLHGKAGGHTCDECGKLLSHKRHLYQHLREVHMKEKHKRCEQCGKSFSRSHGLKRHIESMHGGCQGENRQSSAVKTSTNHCSSASKYSPDL